MAPPKVQQRGIPISMYVSPPADKVSIETMERAALDRLQLLQRIESFRTSGSHFNEYKGALEGDYKKNIARAEKRIVIDDISLQTDDSLSHFALRLAMCSTPDNRQWFASNEVELFRFKASRLSQNDGSFVTFLKEHNIQIESFPCTDSSPLSLELRKMYDRDNKGLTVFKVPFEEAVAAVASRRAVVRDGIAYVPPSEMVSILVGYYRSYLNRSLAATNKSLPSILSADSRLVPLVTSLSNRLATMSSFTPDVAAGSVSLASLDALAAASFPLCMRSMHAHLKVNHHLKHTGRRQYGLYLKGIGLSLEDSLRFFRQEFSKKMPVDKFDKEYAYNIRHSYGKEGKRVDYSPFGCSTIITRLTAPGPGECHGCPYRQWSAERLSLELNSLGLSPAGKERVLSNAAANHYQIACSRAFEDLHGLKIGGLGEFISHPNEYFTKSREHKGEPVITQTQASQMPTQTPSEPLDPSEASAPEEELNHPGEDEMAEMDS